MSLKKPVVLTILDGWGYRAEQFANAVALARKPTYDKLLAEFPNSLLHASDHFVGLPDGQMEVDVRLNKVLRIPLGLFHVPELLRNLLQVLGSSALRGQAGKFNFNQGARLDEFARIRVRAAGNGPQQGPRKKV